MLSKYSLASLVNLILQLQFHKNMKLINYFNEAAFAKTSLILPTK